MGLEMSIPALKRNLVGVRTVKKMALSQAGRIGVGPSCSQSPDWQRFLARYGEKPWDLTSAALGQLGLTAVTTASPTLNLILTAPWPRTWRHHAVVHPKGASRHIINIVTASVFWLSGYQIRHLQCQ